VVDIVRGEQFLLNRRVSLIQLGKPSAYERFVVF
jgi:hypothetical protein